jgi:hypothetical protein
VLHAFIDANGDGAAPDAGAGACKAEALGHDRAGGLTQCKARGDAGCGTAFELFPSAGAWKETIRHDFTGGTDGSLHSGSIRDAHGNAFGTALAGGATNAGLISRADSGEVEGEAERAGLRARLSRCGQCAAMASRNRFSASALQ